MVTTLRKLTKKSRIGFGKHADLTVQQLLDLHEGPYLVWMYYCCAEIDFFPDVLDSIYIKEENRIKKPGKIPLEEFQKIMSRRVRNFIAHSENPAITGRNLKVYRKRRKKGQEIRRGREENQIYNKKAMQMRNQGHKGKKSN